MNRSSLLIKKTVQGALFKHQHHFILFFISNLQKLIKTFSLQSIPLCTESR
jgi:hypothetical protein